MSDNMVERVARALDPDGWDSIARYCDLKGYGAAERVECFANSERIRSSCKQARAAIKAMMEPTEAMRRAYSMAHHKSRVRSGFSLPAYRAMIAASLNEGEAER